MASLSTESTPRERLARLVTVLARARMYWRAPALIAALGLAASLAAALHAQQAWRSETTLLYRDALQSAADPHTAAARAARLGPRLKDTLQARGTLSRVIEELGLYPEKASRSMIEAVIEMQSHLAFRARDSDTYVISFVHSDPATAQRVAALLAERLIEDYRRESLDTATTNRDFLRRELDGASARVDEASRALATFLARNPQFQWGIGDSPYAPPASTIAGGPGGAARPHAAPSQERGAPRRADPELAALERQVAQLDAQLSPALSAPRAPAGAAATPPAPPGPTTVESAQRARDAAAAAATAADAALAERLQSLKPIHPDAVAAKIRVEAARRELAAAEAALRLARAGVTPPPKGGADLDPAKRAELERERSALLRQIAGRRQRLSQGAAPAPARGGPRGAGGGAPVDDIVELETEWHRLRLDLERARDYLRSMQASERMANLQAHAAEKNGHVEMAILDPAYLPARPDRGRGRVFFAGAALSLLFAFGLAGARVLLNDTLHDEDDVRAAGGPPVLAVVPEIPAREAGERAMVPVAPAAEPDPLPAVREEAVTLRFGSPLPLPEVHEAGPPAHRESDPPPESVPPDSASPSTTLAVVGPRAAVRASAVIHEEPDVEVIGVDLDREGDGVYELLRGVSPPVMSALRVLRHRLDQRRGTARCAAPRGADPGAPAGEGEGGPGDGHLVVSIVSPGPLEGKTSLAGRLALTLAEAERARVILVEGNLERPRVAASLGVRLPPYAGLSHQLRQWMLGKRCPLGVVRVGPSIAVLAEPPGGAAYPGVIHSPCFGAAVRLLRSHYDYVVIDGPQVLGAGDANVIEDVSDGVLLVVRASRTRASDLGKAEKQLGARRILGVVVNGARPPVSRA